MDMKNTVILLILLLSILGLIIGAHCTIDEGADTSQSSDDITLTGENNQIVIHIEKIEDNSNLIDKLNS